MRRTVLYGDAWHPIRIRMDWFRDTGIPRLKEIAEEMGRPMPDLCPRIRLRLTDSPLPDGQRIAGEGSLDQVHRDLADLEGLGFAYVLLDTYCDDPEAIRYGEASWAMLATMAEKVLDLGNRTVR